MEEIIKDTLDKYFINLKEYQIFILVLFFIIIALFQIIQAIYISKNIEKFKNVLKKSEIKFSRYHELQVEALKSIYQKLVEFNIVNSSLFKSKYEANDHTHFKSSLSNWNSSYWNCINAFNLEKILLPTDLKILISKTINEFEEVRNSILKEKDALEELEYEFQGNFNMMYDYSDNELAVINNKLATLKERGFLIKSEDNIKALRKSIEDHFAKMNE